DGEGAARASDDLSRHHDLDERRLRILGRAREHVLGAVEAEQHAVTRGAFVALAGPRAAQIHVAAARHEVQRAVEQRAEREGNLRLVGYQWRRLEVQLAQHDELARARLRLAYFELRRERGGEIERSGVRRAEAQEPLHSLQRRIDPAQILLDELAQLPSYGGVV